MRNVIRALVIVACAMPLNATVKTELIDYQVDGKTLQAFVAYDDSVKGPRPGVILFHDWMGRGEYVEGRAKQIAELGYFALAADLYGKGVYAKDHEEAKKLTGMHGDRNEMRSRGLAALDLIRKNTRVNAQKVAAIGYCFGGTASLELARSGADVGGVVVFHGALEPKAAKSDKPIKAKVLALIGADDKGVVGGIPAFEDEMNKAKADWQLNLYSGTVHAFTVKSAGNDPSTGAAYNAQSDKRSWQEMSNFLTEIFK